MPSVKRKIIKYEPKYCELALKALSEGRSKQSVASEIGISYITLTKWVKRHAAFRKAIEAGEDKSYKWWTDHGRKLALDGNGFVWGLMMANRFGWRSKFQADGQEAGPLRIEITDVSGDGKR